MNIIKKCRCGNCKYVLVIPNPKGYIYQENNKYFCDVNCLADYRKAKVKEEKEVRRSYQRFWNKNKHIKNWKKLNYEKK